MHKRDHHYYVYIIASRTHILYTGITNNLPKRLRDHNNNVGAKYTKGRSPVKLLFSEMVESRSAALKREAAIKKLSRQAKLLLIKNAI